MKTVFSNITVWAWDRYVTKQHYARISWQTWKHNLHSSFAFDADTFFTNFLAHPVSRLRLFQFRQVSGHEFLGIHAVRLGGSLLWEEFGENTRPSTNDLIMTTTGGICIGEVLFRLSSQILDDTATGGKRVWREILAAIVDPTRGLYAPAVRRHLAGAVGQRPDPGTDPRQFRRKRKIYFGNGRSVQT